MESLPDISFHDAEVLAVRLDREGPTIEVDVELGARTAQAQKLRLRFERVSDDELGGLNDQNVLFDLKAVRAVDGLWDVTLDPTYGIGGSFRSAVVESAALG